MESLAIRNTQIKGSSKRSSAHFPRQGRLHFQKTETLAGGWMAATNDANQWLQIDVASQFTKITGVATQGRNAPSLNPVYVTSYNLNYSNNPNTWQTYMAQGEIKVK